MNPAARRRKSHRRAVAARLDKDRFSGMMTTAIGGGSLACTSCTLVRPRRELDLDGVCGACRQSWKGLERGIPEARPVAELSTPEVGRLIVYTDASFRDGDAGLAVTGGMGEHSRYAEANSSTHAEVMALRWAMEIAHKARLCDVVFRTDCQAAFDSLAHRGRRFGWVVEQIPRHRNLRADRLASSARQEVLWRDIWPEDPEVELQRGDPVADLKRGENS